ncbi:hypothetical protein A4A49_53097 [Nicotiana attenuata]|uniref:Uncharacterized protein n=1 Tax=Nicotiana attenuata TaxID=49451 RepID=A0A1J6IUT5_NICAT|nr:hypothetical protein A4A49_53097 [Nicotiana attenuata]
MLNGTNFKQWQENLKIVLGVMDFDLALTVDSPPPLTDKNRMCMIMKKANEAD